MQKLKAKKLKAGQSKTKMTHNKASRSESEQQAEGREQTRQQIDRAERARRRAQRAYEFPRQPFGAALEIARFQMSLQRTVEWTLANLKQEPSERQEHQHQPDDTH